MTLVNVVELLSACADAAEKVRFKLRVGGKYAVEENTANSLHVGGHYHTGRAKKQGTECTI